MPMEQKEIESLIKVSIPDAEVTITDLAGDNNHFSAHITSSLFDGKTRIFAHFIERLDRKDWTRLH